MTNERTYRTEFADFDYELPVIPGMADESWVNDVCPVLRGRGFELWCDYADTAKREFGVDTKQFTINRIDADGSSTGECILMTDDLAEAITALASRAPFNLDVHTALIGEGFAFEPVAADWQDSGDAESGPLGLVGHPAFDQYASADEYIMVDESGRVFHREVRDLALEKWIEQNAGGGSL